MHLKRTAVFLFAALAFQVAFAGLSLKELANTLADIKSYSDSCTYEVLLPSLAEPVLYQINLNSQECGNGDTWAPCRYVIEWSLPSDKGITKGFSAYTNGAHYRYRDNKMQEYHAQWDSVPFSPSGDKSRGVQNVVQFAELLPQYIGRQFAIMDVDTTYKTTVTADTIAAGCRSVVVKGKRRVYGCDVAEYEYVLNPDNYLPIKIELENNPGQIGEQSITVRYSSPEALKNNIDEYFLSQRFPDAFGKYRSSSFALENLPRKQLPRIVAPTTTGERYLHERGQCFAQPTVFVFLDSTVGSSAEVVNDVRQAADYLPMAVDVVFAFLDNRTDDIESIAETPRVGEHLLMNTRGAASACGVGADTPVLLFVGTDGVVADFVCGYNKELKSIVIQKASLLH